jgi:cellobiose-specific phosphotransferase system component IIB
MKKLRVLAACALGASISFFTDKMTKAAKKYDIDLEFDLYSVDEAHTLSLKGYDLILVAPQVLWHADRLREHAGETPVEKIEGRMYALMDGDRAVRELVLPHLKLNEEEI